MRRHTLFKRSIAFILVFAMALSSISFITFASPEPSSLIMPSDGSGVVEPVPSNAFWQPSQERRPTEPGPEQDEFDRLWEIAWGNGSAPGAGHRRNISTVRLTSAGWDIYTFLSREDFLVSWGWSDEVMREVRHLFIMMHIMRSGDVLNIPFAEDFLPHGAFPPEINNRNWMSGEAPSRWATGLIDRFAYPYASNSFGTSLENGFSPPRRPAIFQNSVPNSANHNFLIYTWAADLEDDATMQVVLDRPSILVQNELGLIGPFSLSFAGSPTLIAMHGGNQRFFVDRSEGALAVVIGGEAEQRETVGLGEEFWIMPALSGAQTVTILPATNIITGYEEFAFNFPCNRNYIIDFHLWPGVPVTFTADAVIQILEKTVVEYRGNNTSDDEWANHIDIAVGQRGLFRVEINNPNVGAHNTFLRGIDVMFSPMDEEARLDEFRVHGRPIPIWTAEQFSAIRNFPNYDYILMNNISLHNYIEDSPFGFWVPIGEIFSFNAQGHIVRGAFSWNNMFRGTLNGNGFTIDGGGSQIGTDMLINSDNVIIRQERSGLFSALGQQGVAGATVENLGISNFVVNGGRSSVFSNTVTGGDAGALAALTTAETTVRNVHVGGIEIINEFNAARAGGLVGTANGILENVSATDILIRTEPSGITTAGVTGNAGVGGIAGVSTGNINNAHATNIVFEGISPLDTDVFPWHVGSAAGGIAGRYSRISNASVTNVTFNLPHHRSHIGGIGGLFNIPFGDAGEISNSRVTNMTAHVAMMTDLGGIAAIAANVSNSSVDGLVVRNMPAYPGTYVMGGIVGQGEVVASVNVTGLDIVVADRDAFFDTWTHHLGGVMGRPRVNTLTISDAFAQGSITINPGNDADNSVFIGGIVGGANSNLTRNISQTISAVSIQNNLEGVMGIGGIIGDGFGLNPVIDGNVAANPSITHPDASWGFRGRIGLFGTGTFDGVVNLAYEGMIINPTPSDAAWSTRLPNSVHGQDVTAAELLDPQTYNDLGFDIGGIWQMSGGLPQVVGTGPIVPAPNFVITPVSTGVWATGSQTFWLVDTYDITGHTATPPRIPSSIRLTLAYKLERTNGWNTLTPMGAAGDTRVISIDAGDNFVFYYRTNPIDDSGNTHFINEVTMGIHRDTASIGSFEADAEFHVGINKTCASIAVELESGWVFELRLGNSVIGTINSPEQTIELTTPGVYTLREIQAPQGYLLSPSVFEFEFTGSTILFDNLSLPNDGNFEYIGGAWGGHLTLNASNERRPVALDLRKYSDSVGSANLIPDGFEFTVTWDGVDYAVVNSSSQGLNLVLAGIYTITETTAPAGHVLNNTVFSFEIHENGTVAIINGTSTVGSTLTLSTNSTTGAHTLLLNAVNLLTDLQPTTPATTTTTAPPTTTEPTTQEPTEPTTQEPTEPPTTAPTTTAPTTTSPTTTEPTTQELTEPPTTSPTTEPTTEEPTTQPTTQPNTNPNIPPLVQLPDNNLIPDGEYFWELDDEGVPLGRWEWDEVEEMWIFDDDVPLEAFLPLLKTPSDTQVHVGESISWTLQGFHNRTGAALSDFTIADMPGLGLFLTSVSVPALHNGQGVTYDILYKLYGSDETHVLARGVDASSPFAATLPQPGNLYYTEIRFVFGTVPANFGLGNGIVLDFIAGDNAPNSRLINHFIVFHNGGNMLSNSSYDPLVITTMPATGRNDTRSAIAIMLGLTTMTSLVTSSAIVLIKRKKRTL